LSEVWLLNFLRIYGMSSLRYPKRCLASGKHTKNDGKNTILRVKWVTSIINGPCSKAMLHITGGTEVGFLNWSGLHCEYRLTRLIICTRWCPNDVSWFISLYLGQSTGWVETNPN
jgi:hypothetical protein